MRIPLLRNWHDQGAWHLTKVDVRPIAMSVCAALRQSVGLFFIVHFLAGASAIAEEIAESDNQDNEVIHIGMSGAFSGTSGNLGKELKKGIDAYFYQVNQGEGIHGRSISLLSYDDGYDPGPAISNTLRLIQQDKVFALFSYIGTPTVTRVLPILSIYRDKKVFLFFPFTGAEPQRQLPYSRFVYNLRPSYRQETKGLVDKFIAARRTRIAVFYQADAYGRSGWAGIKSALQLKGLDIVGEATYRRGTPYSADYSPQVSILKKLSPDAIISIGSYAAAAGFIRDARNANLNIPIANLSFVNSDSLLQLLVEETEKTGVDYTRNLVNSEVVPNYNDLSFSAVNEYREAMSTLGYNEYSFVSLEGFLNAKLLVEILRRNGKNLNKANIRSTMHSIRHVDIGIKERVSFSSSNNQGLQTVYFNIVENNTYKSVRSFDMWDK